MRIILIITKGDAGSSTFRNSQVEQRDGLADLVILCCSMVLLSGSAAIVAIALWKGFQKKVFSPEEAKGSMERHAPAAASSRGEVPRSLPEKSPPKKCLQPRRIRLQCQNKGRTLMCQPAEDMTLTSFS